jgi:hypothetical protein
LYHTIISADDQFATQLAEVPPVEAAAITWANASALFRHPVPAALQEDPD